MSRKAWGGVVAALCLLLAGGAAHAGGSGTLTQLSTPNDCIAETSGEGCGTANGTGLKGADWIAASPDGKNVYVASFFAGALAELARASDGSLSEIGCISSAGPPECGTAAAGVREATSVTVSPDGKNVYVTDDGDMAVAEFTRNADGTLTALGCLQDDTKTSLSCTHVHGMVNPYDATVTPDGKDVYVAAGGSGGERGAIVELARASDGSLTQLPAPNDCIEEQGSSSAVCGATDGQGLLAATALVVSPDGDNVYSVADTHVVQAGDAPGAIAEFARDPSTGALHQLAGADACIGESTSIVASECTAKTANGLTDAVNVAISPDGASVYAVSDDDRGDVVELARGTGGALTPLGCVSGDASCNGHVDGLASDFGVAVSTDGSEVFVAAAGGNGNPPGIVALARAGDGTLSALDCVQQAGVSGDICPTGTGLADALGVAVSPDGANVYVAASSSTNGAVAAFSLGGSSSGGGGSSGGTGAFSFASPASYPAGQQPWWVTAGDVNGDGKLDLAVPNLHSSSVSVFTGHGDGTFAAKSDVAVGANPGAAAIADVTGDGKRDLVDTDGGDDTLSISPGDGRGGFGTRTTGATGASDLFNQGLAVGDLNGNGKPDVVVANGGAGTVSVFLDGSRSASTFSAGSHPELLALADLNGDGKLDLAVAASGDAAAAVLLGDGRGGFGAPHEVAVGANPSAVAVGDLNGDGKPDPVLSNYDDGTISVLLGHGDGTFQAQTTYASGTNPEDVAIGDLNADGKLDVAVSNGGSDSVSIFPGNGDGTLGTREDFAVGQAPLSLVLADLNGDGALDIATANATSNDVSVLLNQSVPPAPPDQAPVPAFTSSASGLSASFDASGSHDPDGTIVSYAWTFGDGATGSGKAVSHTYAAAGSYEVGLTVTDDDGGSSTIEQPVSVTAPHANEAPKAAFTDSTSTLSVSVDGSGSSDPDGTVASYAWSFGDGATASGKTAAHGYRVPGAYTVTLTVTDDAGATASVSHQVTVQAPVVSEPQPAPPAEAKLPDFPPVARFVVSAVRGTQSTRFAVDASPSADDHGIAFYSWSFGDLTAASSVTASHVYHATGTYTITLTVGDSAGQIDRTSQTVTVRNRPPRAGFSYGVALTQIGSGVPSAVAKRTIAFASVARDDGRIVSYKWSFGDGAHATGQRPTHVYAGTNSHFVVTLQVRDDDGAKGTIRKTINVATPPAAVLASEHVSVSDTPATPRPVSVSANEHVTVSDSGSTPHGASVSDVEHISAADGGTAGNTPKQTRTRPRAKERKQ